MIARKTYHEFERAHLLSPHKILAAGWDTLVEILDRGAYVRYDFKTATKLLNVSHALVQQYKGDLNVLHADAHNLPELEQRLRNLGKGIGTITINIFLRELRGIWAMVDPAPTERVIQAAKELGFIQKNIHDDKRILDALKTVWQADGMQLQEFADFEAALVRYAITFYKKSQTIDTQAVIKDSKPCGASIQPGRPTRKLH